MTTQARMPSLTRGLAFVFASAAISIGASAQTQVKVLVGDVATDYFGFTATALGDVNADGTPDFAVSGYRGSGGRIKVYSGDDGSLLHHILGAGIGGTGLVFPVGDVDGDGYDDFGGNHAFSPSAGAIFSGRDGSTIASQAGAFFSGGIGDTDQDGFADYVISQAWPGNPYQVTSGMSGNALSSLSVPASYWFAGFVGDLSGDGVSEYATPRYTGPNSGSIEFRSGADHSVILATPPIREDIIRVTGLGDIDQDGQTDIGVVFENFRSIDILSGADGSTLVSLREIDFFLANTFLAGVPDADGDGYDDFVVASQPARLYSGRTGAILAQFIRDNGRREASSVAGLPDTNGDGRPEIVVGSPGIAAPNTFAGTAALYSYDGPAGVNYCVSNVNSTGEAAIITASGSTSLMRNNLLLSVHAAPKGSLGIFLMGDGQQQTTLGSGVLCVGSGGSGITRLPLAPIDANGHMLLELDSTNLPSGAGTISAGTTRNFQAWFRDSSPTGAVSNLSDAVTVTFSL